MLRSWSAGLLLGALALLATPAADAPDPPPGAPAFRAPAGSVLFAADFRRTGLDRWAPDREGVWSVVDGALCARLPDRKQARSFIYAGDPEWADYAVDLDLCQTRGVDKGIAVRVAGRRGIGVDLRGGQYNDVLLHRGEWPMGHAPVDNRNGRWHHLRVEARGDVYRVLVDGEPVLERDDPHRSRPKGRIALGAYTGGVGECTVYYANVVVTALP